MKLKIDWLDKIKKSFIKLTVVSMKQFTSMNLKRFQNRYQKNKNDMSKIAIVKTIQKL